MKNLGVLSRVRLTNAGARHLFAEDAAAWRLRAGTAAAIAVAPIALALIVAATHLVRPVYRFLTAEDSVLEWSQFVCVAATAVVLGSITWRLARRRDWAWVALFGAGTLVAAVVAGEEISWGQRLFSLATPEVLEGVNTQGEANLHNVRGVLGAVNFATMIGAAVLTGLSLGLALASSVSDRPRAWRTAYRIVPPLALVPAFAIPFAYRFARFVRNGGTSGSYAEVVELILYFGLLAFAMLIRRRIGLEEWAARD